MAWPCLVLEYSSRRDALVLLLLIGWPKIPARLRTDTMKLSLIAAVLPSISLAAASAVALPGHKRTDHISQRPEIVYSPESPSTAPPNPKQRCKTCFIDSHGDGVTDDSDYILEAFNKCNNGGHVVFREGETYIIGTAMDWTFLNSIDIGELVQPRASLWPSTLIPSFLRYSGRDPLLQRHDVLAGEFVSLRLPERDVVFQAWRQ